MNKVYIENGNDINLDDLKILSTHGSEVVVYNDENLVYKIFRDNYKFTHKTEDELDYLSSLKTSRILMPKQKLYKNGKLIGYTMKFISDKKNILNERVFQLLNELSMLQNDVEIISNAGIRLLDINGSNCVCNHGIYLIDFGNYKINENNDMFYDLGGKKHFIDNDNHCMVPIDNFDNPTNLNFIKKWNYSKINSLICEMLFMNNPEVDFYVLRKIIDFLREKRIDKGELYDLSTYKQYLDNDLQVGSAVKKFIVENIRVDSNEQDEIVALMEK